MELPKSNFIDIMRRRAGHPPGSLITQHESETQETLITFISFNENEYTKKELGIEDISTSLQQPNATDWIHVSGFKNIEIFGKIGEVFQINPLIIEDALNHEHLPKAEEMDEHLFITLKLITRGPNLETFDSNHFSFVLNNNLLISFAQYRTEVFDGFIQRIEKAVGKIRQRKEDYIMYRLIDIITDQYYLVFESLEEELFDLEEKLGNNKLNEPAERITRAKKNTYYLKKYLQPTTEAFFILLKSENNLIKNQNRRFYSDVLDHLKHLLSALEGYRETAMSLMELHMANNANRMNEVMKTLTVIATIFIPLTFIAGIYGMNFKYMPELSFKWGYPILLTFMFSIGTGMFLYMKRKNWF